MGRRERVAKVSAACRAAHGGDSCIPSVVQVVDRVRWKAATYGQEAAAAPTGRNGTADSGAVADSSDDGGSGSRYKVAPETIAMLYDKWVMPMTKQVSSLLA